MKAATASPLVLFLILGGKLSASHVSVMLAVGLPCAVFLQRGVFFRHPLSCGFPSSTEVVFCPVFFLHLLRPPRDVYSSQPLKMLSTRRGRRLPSFLLFFFLLLQLALFFNSNVRLRNVEIYLLTLASPQHSRSPPVCVLRKP